MAAKHITDDLNGTLIN